MHKSVTRDSIIEFIRANQYRSNPGSTMPLSEDTTLSCEYFDGDDLHPSCVIGNVLFEAGHTAFDIMRYGQGLGARSLFGYLGLPEGGFASDVQRYADRGYTWGTALQLALIKRGEA